MHRDLLRARAGLLRDHDPLVDEVEKLQQTVHHLSITTHGEAKRKVEVDRLGDVVRQLKQKINEFERQNALLQNSLAYFDILTTRLRDIPVNGSTLTEHASALEGALLHVALEPSHDSVAELDDAIHEFEHDKPAGWDAQLAEALISHAKILRTALPATDYILKSVLTIPSKSRQVWLRNIVLVQEELLKSGPQLSEALFTQFL